MSEDIEQEYVWVEDYQRQRDQGAVDVYLPHDRYNRAGNWMPLQNKEVYLVMPTNRLERGGGIRIMMSVGPNSAIGVGEAYRMSDALFIARTMNKSAGVVPKEPSKLGYHRAYARAIRDEIDRQTREKDATITRLQNAAMAVAETIEREER